MGLEIALLAAGVLLFAGIAVYSLRDQAGSVRPAELNAEPEGMESDPVGGSEPVAVKSELKLDKVEKVRAVVAAGTRTRKKKTPVMVKKPGPESESKAVVEKVVPPPAVPAQEKEASVSDAADPVDEPKTEIIVEIAEDTAVELPAVEEEAVEKAPAAVGSASRKHTAATDESDLEIDFVARIKIGKPVMRDEILGVYRQHEYQFEKPSKIFGLNEVTNLWCDLELELDSATFSQIGASIQLADKSGPITEDELNRFSQMMLTMADSLNRPFRFSMEFEEALERAAHLDQLGRRYDAMAVLNIIARQKSGFRSIDIESCARDLQMYKNLTGVYVRADSSNSDSGRAIYRMAPADERGQLIGDRATDANVKDLVLYMNVPATRDPEQVFHRMMEDARSLAEWLDGKIIDQHGRHMTARGFKLITRQIREISQDMRKDGLKPGDTVSSKLF